MCLVEGTERSLSEPSAQKEMGKDEVKAYLREVFKASGNKIMGRPF
jgi:hypothetical protein